MSKKANGIDNGSRRAQDRTQKRLRKQSRLNGGSNSNGGKKK